MGLILVALKAGIKPINVPNMTSIMRATKITDIDTEAFTNVASSPCPHTRSMTIKIHPPRLLFIAHFSHFSS